MNERLEVIVVGGGIAGMAFAHGLAEAFGPRALRIRLLMKASSQDSSSSLAQGGMAASLHKEDSVEEHVQDTLRTGAGRNDEGVVRAVVSEAPRVVERLVGWGAQFDRDSHGRPALAREGGHGRARVVHRADSTGAEIVRVLQQQVMSHVCIERYEGARAMDLLVDDGRCKGVRAMDMNDGTLRDLHAHLVVMATGGAGQLYSMTTNPSSATGDGLAMAARAGVPLRDMAFVQFHPTAFHSGRPGRAFLISEAVRGAGARLLNIGKRPFMHKEHVLGDLAPRSIVARAIAREMKRDGSPHVWLDAGPIGMARFGIDFPNIDRWCEAHGYVPGRDLIPVAPAAHFLCGGIVTDLAGRSAMPGLLAMGECAFTGLHGADRLASNSLLEALVIPDNAVRSLRSDKMKIDALPADRVHGVRLSRHSPLSVELLRTDLQHAMDTHVGLERSANGLRTAHRAIARCERHLRTLWARRRWSAELMDLRDLLTVAQAIVEDALKEPVSIGSHHLIADPFAEEGLFRSVRGMEIKRAE
jgi:L-aspartate oxidase